MLEKLMSWGHLYNFGQVNFKVNSHVWGQNRYHPHLKYALFLHKAQVKYVQLCWNRVLRKHTKSLGHKIIRFCLLSHTVLTPPPQDLTDGSANIFHSGRVARWVWACVRGNFTNKVWPICETGQRKFQIALTFLFFLALRTTPFWKQQREARQNGASSSPFSDFLGFHRS